MEIINSFFTNIKDKLTNPFFGTLILVLIIHHWELWFSIFNFDDDCTLEDKVIFIKIYIENNSSIWLFSSNIVLAIFFMFIGYLVIVGTRSLVMWVEFWLMPSITKIIVNKNVVRKSEFDEVVKEREEYFDKYEEQRKNVRIYSKTIDEQTEQIILKGANFIEQTNIISRTQKELESKKKELDILKSEKQADSQLLYKNKISLQTLQSDNETQMKQIQDYRNLFFSSENKSFFNATHKFPPEILHKVKELKDKDKWDTFKNVGLFITNGGQMGYVPLEEMVKMGISCEGKDSRNFTPLGEIIWNYRKLFEGYNHDILLISNA
jgi:hypothetical protein